MKNYDFQEKQFQIYDPIGFESISTCDVKDGICICRCLVILKKESLFQLLVILKISNISWY